MAWLASWAAAAGATLSGFSAAAGQEPPWQLGRKQFSTVTTPPAGLHKADPRQRPHSADSRENSLLRNRRQLVSSTRASRPAVGGYPELTSPCSSAQHSPPPPAYTPPLPS